MSGRRSTAIQTFIALALAICFTTAVHADEKQWLTYKGGAGPGKGKHIVFITGDEEYRSEESMPAMAKILSQRHGFRCTVLFSINPASGEIDPKVDDNIPGLDALKTADLAVVFTRFRHLPEAQMALFADYVDSGRPVIGIRTATHAFDYDRFQNEKYSKWAWRNSHPDFKGGFGRQVLGETWIDHYGGYHGQSTLGIIEPEMKNHPILRGIDRIWGLSHAYKITKLEGDSQRLVMGQPLKGLKPTDAPDEQKPPVPVAWIKTFTGSQGKVARVFTTTMGNGDDFKEEAFRRLFVNACYWCVGLEGKIPALSNVKLVGTYDPKKSDFGAYRRGVTPAELQKNLSTEDLADVPDNDREAEFYPITNVPLPADAVMEAGSMLSLPDGRLAIGTRRGEVYIATGADTTPAAPHWNLFATGLTEVLGLGWRDGTLYATQQGEITRLRDTYGTGRADRFETVSDAWAWGDEHEYTFGSNFDRDGAIWTVHCLTGSYTSDRLFRGWALRHFPDGRTEPMCSGLRSPGGVAFNLEGDAFYTENQGPWNSFCALRHLKPGSFQGHPAGNKWYDHAPNMGPRPAEPTGGDNGRREVDVERIPQLVLPAVVFPYKKMGQSASAIMLDVSAGKFGPFAGQHFVADYTLSVVMRAEMEKVNGVYQGACFPFRQGFSTGIIGGTLTPRGQIFVGGSKRGWPVRGLADKSLQRVDWTGKTPFEIQTMRVKPDGFELRFTSPVDPATARDPGSYTMETFTHHYYGAYGGPEIEQADQRIVSAVPSADGLTVRLVIDKLVRGHVHELHLTGLHDRAGQPLLHDVAYYTLNEIPKP